MNIQFIESPNYDSNRKKIDRLVIHWIVGNLQSADIVFQKPDGVSAHYGIEDNIIHQYVKEENVAYHAGNYEVNQKSIGIEHSAAPDRPASEETYKTSAELVADICNRYAIPIDRQHIIKHSQVRPTQCPGTVDIDRIIRDAIEINTPELQFSDQTKIPKELLGEDQDLEIQQIKGLLLDGKRDNLDLENCRNANDQQAQLIDDLQKKLDAAKTSKTSKTVTLPDGGLFHNPLAELLYHLVLYLEKHF